MDNKLILVKIITLLFLETTLESRSENSSELCRSVLETIKMPEATLTISDDSTMLTGLRSTAVYLCNLSLSEVVDKDDLIQRLRLNCGSDDRIYSALESAILPEIPEDQLKKKILSIRQFLKDTERQDAIIKALRQAAADVTFGLDKIKNMGAFVSGLISKLEPFQKSDSKSNAAIVSSVDFGDESQMDAAFDEVKDTENEKGILQLGWQDINRMLQGGFRRGEQWVLPALQHKYKTGFSLSVFKQIAMYNTPYMIDPKKKPMLVRISFEDNMAPNLRFLYENIYFNEHGKMPDIKQADPKQMGAAVMKCLTQTGYYIRMVRVNPSEWNYRDLQNYILDLEAQGYEIHLCMVDYLPMIPTAGCEEGPAGHALRDLYRRTRNFFSARKITLITPHQLSTDAKQLIRDERQDFVKQVLGKGYFAGSKQIDQEVDGELYLHIEKFNKKAYLTLHRGKHRGVPVIPDEHMYVILPFPDKGPIPDDLGKPNIACSKIGGGSIGSTNEAPLLDF
jgi:hypothetical protein